MIIVNKRMIVEIFSGDNKSQRSLVKATKSKANPEFPLYCLLALPEVLQDAACYRTKGTHPINNDTCLIVGSGG